MSRSDHLNAARSLLQSFGCSDGSSESDIDSLKAQLDRQNLILQTMLVILLDKGVFQEHEFHDWAKIIDEMDGSRDFRLSTDKLEVTCGICNRKNPANSDSCSVCGAALDPVLISRPRSKP